MRRLLVLPAVLTASLLVASCGSATSTESSSAQDGSATAGDGLNVVAAFYPLEYAATNVGGDAVSVISLTPPGVEPHDLELSAAQVAQIAEADLVLYIPGFQPAVDEAVEQQAADRALDVTAGLTLIAGEEHAEGESTPRAKSTTTAPTTRTSGSTPPTWQPSAPPSVTA